MKGYQSHTHNHQNRLRPSGPMLNLLLWFWLPRFGFLLQRIQQEHLEHCRGDERAAALYEEEEEEKDREGRTFKGEEDEDEGRGLEKLPQREVTENCSDLWNLVVSMEIWFMAGF